MIGAAPDIEAFLEMLSAERGAAVNTIEAYRRDLGDISAYLLRRGSSLRAAAPADLSAYFTAASAAGLKPASRARRRTSLRSVSYCGKCKWTCVSMKPIIFLHPIAGTEQRLY